MPDKVVVVDDEPDILNLTKLVLEKRGYQVICTSSGDEALRKIETEMPDVVLLDVVMPGKSGLEVCKTLKADPKMKLIPVVMFTVLGRDIDRKMILDCGADSHFTKPFTPDALAKEISEQIAKNRSERFSKQLGISHRELIGRKILIEFEPSATYDRFVRDFILECIANKEDNIVLTQKGSAVHHALEKDEPINLVHQGTSHVFLTDVLKDHNARPLGIVYDSLTDLALSLDAKSAYKFARDSLGSLSDPQITAIYLLNSSAHDPREVRSIEGVFSNSIGYSNAGVANIR